MQLQPYLMFEGRCEEAAKFYEKAIGAKIEKLLRYKDSPDPGTCPSPDREKIMHMSLRIGDQTVLASDGECKGKPSFQGFSLSLNVSNEAEASRLFSSLQERGFIDCMTKGAFSRKALHATEWRLTWWTCDVTGNLPSSFSRA